MMERKHGGMVEVFGAEKLLPGMSGVISEVTGAAVEAARFGVVPGVRVFCRHRGPGGHLMVLELLGTMIAVRGDTLRGIVLRRCV